MLSKRNAINHANQIFSKRKFAWMIAFFFMQFSAQAQLQKLSAESIQDKQIQQLLKSYDTKINFIENKGQWPKEIRYRANFSTGQALVTNRGMLVGMFDTASLKAAHDLTEKIELKDNPIFNHDKKNDFIPDSVKMKGHGWLMNFLNASASMKMEAKQVHKEKFNYFIGSDKSKYATDVNSYQEIWYKNIYPHTDVRYYPSETGELEYDIICKPGFKNEDIAIQFEGISSISVQKDGSLVLKTSIGDMILPKPFAYQNNGKDTVHAEYVISDKNVIRFRLGVYDRSKTLIIDPIALRWATWINNTSEGDAHGHGVWVDNTDGTIYVTGYISNTGLITVNAFQDYFKGDVDIFLARYQEPLVVGGVGDRLWQTYIGSNYFDNPYVLEQGADGNIYVGGVIQPPTGAPQIGNFPLLGGSAFSGPSLNSSDQFGINIFLSKINKNGNSIKSAILGGDQLDYCRDLRIASNGNIILGGYSTSDNLGTVYPGTGATDVNFKGYDVLIININNDLNAISWIKNFGGIDNDYANILLLNNKSGDIFVGGRTLSYDFPVLNAREPGYNSGNENGFLQRINSSGTLLWSSYFTSDFIKNTTILCMDFNNTMDAIYLGGITTGLNPSNISSTGVFSNSINTSQGLAREFFVAKMGIDQQFGGATYLGGSAQEGNMMGLAVDKNNDVYIFGYSESLDFPVTPDALQKFNGGFMDKTFTKLSSDLSTLKYSTYYGGNFDEYDPVGERGIKFSNCRIYTIVTAGSNNIPLTENALTTTKLSQNFYEPGLVVWANPPDISNNSITSDQLLCQGETPQKITGTIPEYILPTLSRNTVSSPHPSVGAAAKYQWQKSIDKNSWTDINNAISQDVDGAMIGPVSVTTYIRRILNGDACMINGDNDFVTLTVKPAPPPTISSLVQPTCTLLTGSINLSSLPSSINWTLTMYPGNISFNGNSTGKIISGLMPGAYSFKVVNPLTGCTSAFSDTANIVKHPGVFIATRKDTTLCKGDVVELNTTGGVSYSWLPSATLSASDIDNPVAKPVDTTQYIVKGITAEGCIGFDTVVINVNQLPIVKTITDTAICINSQLPLNATGAIKYNWTPSLGLTNINIADPIAKPLVSTKYILTGMDANGCKAKDSVEVKVNPLPVIVRSANDTICHDTKINISANGGTQYTWTPASSLNSSSISNPIASPTVSTTYIVKVKDNNMCEQTDSVKIFVRQKSVFSIIPDRSICNNEQMKLSASGGDSYSWSPALGLSNVSIPDPVATPQSTTNYKVHIVSTACNDIADLSTIVEVRKAPVVTASKSNDIDCSKLESVLSANGAVSYSWSPATGLNNANISNPIAKILTTQQFIVKGKNAEGCFDTDTITVNVKFINTSIHYVPNAFSPNGDGLNDCYRIQLGGFVTDFHLSIYNRFGEQVFYTEDPYACWDGTYKGKKADADNYVYYVTGNTSCGTINQKGNLVLVQ